MQHFYPFKLFKSFLVFALLTGSAVWGECWGQATLIDEPLTNGNMPAGWSQTEITFETAAGGYALFDDNNAILITPVFNASAYISIDIHTSVAKFGTGGDGPITVNFSLDGGTTWQVAGNTSTPESSTYNDDIISINTGSSQMQIRFSRENSPSQKRLRDIEIFGYSSGDFDCPDLFADFGDACDDADPQTENDTVNGACECIGTAIIYDCPSLSANFGDPCDDVDPGTMNDIVSSSCICEGSEIVIGADCGLEDFTNSNLTGSYSDGSFIGNNGIEWAYIESRDEDGDANGSGIAGNAVMLRQLSDNSSITSSPISGGISDFSVKLYKGFTGAGNRQVEFFVNGISYGTSEPFDDFDEHIFSFNGINTAGDVIIEIRNFTSKQIILDDISWTCFSADPCEDPLSTLDINPAQSILANSLELNWTPEAGYNTLIIAREAVAATGEPVDGTNYSANINYGEGAAFGGGFVVYSGSGNQTNINSLTPGTIYHFTFYPFCPGLFTYYEGFSSSGQVLTAPDEASISIDCATDNSISLSWEDPENGNFDGFILVGRNDGIPTSIHSFDPVNSAEIPNLDFPSADLINSNKYLFNGTGNSATVTGLSPGVMYYFKIFIYEICGVDCGIISNEWEFSEGTQISQLAGLPEISNIAASTGNQQVELSWTNPDPACFDEVIVVAHNQSISGTPSGNYTANSSNYSDATNPNFPEGGKVVYNGTESSVVVNGLTNAEQFCFKIFTRTDTSYSGGVQICAVPSDVTILEPGDLAIIAVNTDFNNNGDDEFCFITFKDLIAGTSIDFTDNGYERGTAGLWGDTEGVIRITYTGTVIPAGTVICVRGKDSPANFEVLNCGNESMEWDISSLNGTSQLDLNSSDQLWIMQFGSWINNSDDDDSYYTGNVLYGWTGTGWEIEEGYDNSSGSTIYPNSGCFNTDIDLGSSKLKYTGSMTSANQQVWIQRINDGNNWTEYIDNPAYFAADPDYSGECIEFNNLPSSFTDGVWTGAFSNNWFDCRNWENLRIPEEDTDVVIPVGANNIAVINTSGAVARTLNIMVDNGFNMTAGSSLDIYGDLIISYGNTFQLNNGTILFKGPNDSFISGIGNATLENVVMDKPGSSLSVNRPLTIQDNMLFLSGHLYSGPTYPLLFGTGGSATGASQQSFVYGPVRKIGNTAFTFPIGDTHYIEVNEIITEYPRYQPARIFNLIGLGTFVAQYHAEKHPGAFWDIPNNPKPGTCDYWSINKISGGEASIALKYEDPDNDPKETCNYIPEPDYLRISHWVEDTNLPEGGAWTYIPSTGNSASFEAISDTSVTYFGDFVLSNESTNNNVLPIQLLSFTATPLDNNEVLGKWTTASEINNDFFTLERSVDGINFVDAGRINGAGNSSTALHYKFIDKDAFAGTSYYRLKQNDFDGKFSYSEIESVFISNSRLAINSIYKNENGLNLFYYSDAPLLVLEIYDVLGKRQFADVINNHNGQNLIQPQLQEGIYFLRLSHGERMVSEKFFY